MDDFDVPMIVSSFNDADNSGYYLLIQILSATTRFGGQTR